jgi:hypothetical protein
MAISRMLKLLRLPLKGRHNNAAPTPSAAANMHPLYDRISQLVADDDMEGALQVLIQAGFHDAALLKAQLEMGRTRFAKHRMDEADWSRMLARIRYAILHVSQENPDAESFEASTDDKPIKAHQCTKIKELVLSGQTEHALALCDALGANFKMARDRFIQAKKDWDAGQIDEPAWQSIRIKTDAALLFYVEIHPKSSD